MIAPTNRRTSGMVAVLLALSSLVITMGTSRAVAVTLPAISAPPNVVVGMADGHVDLPVTLSAPGAQTVSVDYAVTGGPCNSPTPSAGGTLTFTPGVTKRVFRAVLNDCEVPGSRGLFWFLLRLSNATNATIVNPSTLVGVVGDPPPGATTPGLSVRDAVVDTSAGTVNVPILLGGPKGATSTGTVTVHYTTNNGTALAGTDYATRKGTLTFDPGSTVQNISVPITNRSGAAPSRSFSITLGAASNAVVTDGTGVVTIGASGSAAVTSPAISAPPNVVVGMADGYVDLPVTLSAPSTQTVTVDYAASPGGGCNFPTPSTSGTLTFTPGMTTKIFRAILNDCGAGGMTWFKLTLTNANNATTVNPNTVVGVVGDPAPGTTTPGLSVRDAVVDTSAGMVNVPVLLGGPRGATSTKTVTVDYTTNNGTALAGTDYVTTTGTLTFGPGSTVQNISVPIANRSGAAPSRSFSITLGSVHNAVVTDGTGVVTIGASGAAAVTSPLISAPANTVVARSEGYLDLPVTLSAPSTQTVTVDYNVQSGGCNFPTPSTSGTLTFTAGVTTKIFRAIINDCPTETATASFTLQLSRARKGHIARAKTKVTVPVKVTAPHSPTGLIATAGIASATISFTPPTSDGGDPINSYTITASPGGATATGIASPISVHGLTPGTSYTFTARATNSLRTGPASAPSNPVTPS
jgi:hypothetical protein